MSDLSKINFSGTEYNIKDATARAEAAKKVAASGGDLSNTKIVTADSITTEFPVPAANDTAKGFLGKMKKFCTDFNSFKTGIITLGKLVNNGLCTESGYALDARMGKTLLDFYTQLNSDLNNAIEYGSNGKTYRSGVNAAGVAYIQTQFQNGTIQELHITSDGKVESVFYNGSEWVLNGQLATKDDIPSGLINKQVLYGTTKVTTDANGAGWIPFAPNFKDANITFIVGQTDSNMVDRETHTLAYNGAAIVLYKNGTVVANSHGWISWIAIGTPL